MHHHHHRSSSSSSGRRARDPPPHPPPSRGYSGTNGVDRSYVSRGSSRGTADDQSSRSRYPQRRGDFERRSSREDSHYRYHRRDPDDRSSVSNRAMTKNSSEYSRREHNHQRYEQRGRGYAPKEERGRRTNGREIGGKRGWAEANNDKTGTRSAYSEGTSISRPPSLPPPPKKSRWGESRSGTHDRERSRDSRPSSREIRRSSSMEVSPSAASSSASSSRGKILSESSNGADVSNDAKAELCEPSRESSALEKEFARRSAMVKLTRTRLDTAIAVLRKIEEGKGDPYPPSDA